MPTVGAMGGRAGTWNLKQTWDGLHGNVVGEVCWCDMKWIFPPEIWKPVSFPSYVCSPVVQPPLSHEYMLHFCDWAAAHETLSELYKRLLLGKAAQTQRPHSARWPASAHIIVTHSHSHPHDCSSLSPGWFAVPDTNKLGFQWCFFCLFLCLCERLLFQSPSQASASACWQNNTFTLRFTAVETTGEASVLQPVHQPEVLWLSGWLLWLESNTLCLGYFSCLCVKAPMSAWF